MSNRTDWVASFEVSVVNEQFFLNRIRAFERQYRMDWDQFLSRYKAGKLENDGAHMSDYSEWAFLCHSFMPQLLCDLVDPTIDTGPPECTNSERQKPEANSGFSFLEGKSCSISICTSTLSPAYWKPTKGVSRFLGIRLTSCPDSKNGRISTSEYMCDSQRGTN